MPLPSETELKLEIPKARLGKAAHLAWLDKLRSGPCETEELVSVYFDTPKEALKRHHLGLRVRHKDGKHVQTAKEGFSPIDRREWEQEIPGDLPDRKLARRTALKPFASKRKWKKLEPLFETKVERISIPLRVQGAQVSMALDKGRVTAKGRELPISEVELELKEGDAAELAALARRLADDLPLHLSLESKAARGYALLDNDIGKPQKAAALEVRARQTAAEGFTLIALSCLGQVTSNRAAVLKGDAEGVHQMRVGLRRLRAALSLFKEMLRSPETEQVKDDLKWLTEQLAPARDLDVFVAKSVAPIEKAEGKHAPLKRLKQELSAKREQGLEKAIKTVNASRYRKIVLETGLWILAGRWARSGDDIQKARRMRALGATARDILDERAKKVRKKLRRLDGMDAEERHKLRIAVKKLRYATEFFATLYDKGGAAKRRRAFSARLKELQSALGRLNDIHVHEEFARKRIRKKAKGGGEKVRVFGLGFVTGREREDAAKCLAEAGRRGKRFARQARYWR